MITRLSNEYTIESLSFFFANTVANNSTRMCKYKSIVLEISIIESLTVFSIITGSL